MKTVSLSGSLRENVGKKDAKKQRREFKVPCVLYGGKEQIHFVADEKILMKIMHTPVVQLIKLNVNGLEHDAIVQDIQYHPVTDRMLHVDFLQILPEKPVVIGVPVKVTGVAPGVLRGGRLVKKLRKVTVKALMKDLPDDVTVSIDGLEIGDTIKIADMKLDQVTFLDPASNVIIGVYTARAVVEEVVPGAEAAAETAEGAAPAAEGEKKTDKKSEK
ncbi:MAG: 50S ribosomal protein L25 [Bacteroidales bacterium]|nr:50S ribosomal protein L25 [Bacteroidales bacterium]MDD4603141.1 50S ribosomal protein L25 [Bacteroidales bacterium]